jgi:UDP-N-acetylmuramoylalanine--D-glutamate ligase
MGRQNYLIAGLGRTGWSCVRYLHALGADISVTDTRGAPPLAGELAARYPDITKTFGKLDKGLLQKADVVLVSPGLALDDPFFEATRKRGLPILGDVELFARVADKPMAAITGSNGKSTVTRLVADMALAAGRRAPAGGNLGTPALDLLDSSADLYVLELSSFQLELTEDLSPAVGAVLNVCADHMDRHGTLERYAAAKARIYEGAELAVINADDPLASAMGLDAPGRIAFTAGEPDGVSVYGLREQGGRVWLVRGGQRLLAADELRLRGRHNLMNALAALAVGEGMGFDQAAMHAALKAFPGLPHRCRRVGERGGVNYYNDSKATNVGAALASLEGLPGPIVWLAGGQSKGADFSPLAAVVRDKVRAVLLFGEDAGRIAAVLPAGVPRHFYERLDEAVEAAAGLAQSGDSVLLAPACASFDMFTGFEGRGKCFEAAVEALHPCAV